MNRTTSFPTSANGGFSYLTEGTLINIEDKPLHPAAFEGTTKILNDAFQRDMHSRMSIKDAMLLFSRFDAACTVAEHFFPKAQDGKIIINRVETVLKHKGFNKDNTLFAQSICPDEINHEVGDMCTLFHAHLGEVFHLGGLGGIPFTGKTGFSAFSQHIPNDGHIFILFAPHIGISEDLKLGAYHRDGQDQHGAACGAAVGAFNHCCGGGAVPDEKTLGACPYDYQMQYIIHEISKVSEKVNSEPTENEKMAALVKEMYKICLHFMNKIIDVNITDGQGKKGCKIILLGGIQINMPRPMPDFFQPIMFEIRSAGEETIDLMTSFD